MRDPIIVGMEVVEGTLRVGTPLCIPAKGGMEIGRVSSIEQVSCYSHTVLHKDHRRDQLRSGSSMLRPVYTISKSQVCSRHTILWL